MNPKSAIAKGKLLENYVAGRIQDMGLDSRAQRSHGSGNTNTEKSDIWTSLMILGKNAGIECKNQSKLNIPDWWRQVQKLESLGREPILVFKMNQEPLEETKCIIYLDTFLQLLTGGQVIPEMDVKNKWKVQKLVESAKEIIKIFDKKNY